MIGKTISHYKIVDKLGEGGMGAVYKAEDTTLRRLVALKALSSHLAENEEARERFVREAQAASAINHPNITTVFELLEEDDTHFIAMEYVDGKTIRDMVESGHVSIRKAVDIILHAAEALDAAHRKGILHRDVKSANIMVSMEGNVKVMDFGLAHLEERSQLTRTGTTMGTLAYSSPEQLVGHPYDERSEIWSLGVVFYELLTGQLPFKSPSEGELVFAIINNEQDRLSKLRGDVPESIEVVVNRMLFKKPELRYQSCSEVVNELRRLAMELETTSIRVQGVFRSSSRLKRYSIIGIPIMIGIAAIIVLSVADRQAAVMPELMRLTVLPFEYQGPQEFESYAITLPLRIYSRLIGLSGLEVHEFPSTDQIRDKSDQQIGEEWNVDSLLKGRIQVLNDPELGIRIRMFPRLIRTSDSRAIWASTDPFEVAGPDIIELESVVATRVAQELDVVLLESERAAIDKNPTDNTEAYTYYLRGEEYRTQTYAAEGELRLAEEMFQRAIDLDPDFALAHAWLSFIHQRLYWFYLDHTEERLQRALSAAEYSLELDPDLAEGHWALGRYYYVASRDYQRALTQFRRALELKPNAPEFVSDMGYSLRRQGRIEESLEYLERAHQLDPVTTQYLWELGVTYWHLREHERAIEYFDIALSLSPDWTEAHYMKAWTIITQTGDVKEAAEIFGSSFHQFSGEGYFTVVIDEQPWWMFRILGQELEEMISGFTLTTFGVDTLSYHLTMAEFHERSGNHELAQDQFRSIKVLCENNLNAQPDEARYHSFLGIALAGLGNGQKAVEEAERAVQLMPMDADVFWGRVMHENLAWVYVKTGKYSQVTDELELLLSSQCMFTVQLLLHDPIWDPLRDSPEYRALVRDYRSPRN